MSSSFDGRRLLQTRAKMTHAPSDTALLHMTRRGWVLVGRGFGGMKWEHKHRIGGRREVDDERERMVGENGRGEKRIGQLRRN